MKSKIILLLLIFLLPVLAEAQSPAINKFYRNHKRDKGMMNANLPGWLVKLGVGIAHPFVDDEEARIALRMARKVGKTKFMVSEDYCNIDQGQYLKLLSGVKREGYEVLIQVRDDGENVTILSRERRGVIRNLLIVVREEDSFVLLSMKARIKLDDIADMINDVMELEKEKKEKKDKKHSTYFYTLENIKLKKSIKEIAEIRGLAEATIASHFIKIKNEFPDADLSFYRPSDALIKKVKKEFDLQKKGEAISLKNIYEGLNKKVSYVEIKLAVAFL